MYLKIMVFLHGITITEENGVDMPVGDAATKVQAWRRHGAEVVYLTHRRKLEDIEKEKVMLAKHGFPAGPIFFRAEGEEYGNVAERVLLDIIVEDDCASIGGEKEMTYPHIRPEIRSRIVSVVVKESVGIDHLPSDPLNLK